MISWVLTTCDFLIRIVNISINNNIIKKLPCTTVLENGRFGVGKR